jgi:hypothetical protein
MELLSRAGLLSADASVFHSRNSLWLQLRTRAAYVIRKRYDHYSRRLELSHQEQLHGGQPLFVA